MQQHVDALVSCRPSLYNYFLVFQARINVNVWGDMQLRELIDELMVLDKSIRAPKIKPNPSLPFRKRCMET